MASGYYLADGVTDLDAVFEPGTTGAVAPEYFRQDNGAPLQYAGLSYGTAAAVTNYEIASSADFSAVWAKKGSVAYLANPQTWNTANYDLWPSGNVAAPTYAIIPMVSSVREADHQQIVVRVTFNPDGTWQASMASTNHDNDYFWYYNTTISQYLTLYNSGNGNFTNNFQVGQSGAAGAISSPTVLSGNWLQTPTAGAGAGYVISASFSPVYDYTARGTTQSGVPFSYTQGLQGATSGMSIACNGGFVVDSSGTLHTSVTNMSLANPVSICYEWNSSGGFGGNLAGFEGADAVLRWLVYTIATVTLSNVAGTTSATGTLALGAHVSWEYYDAYNPPNTYPGGRTLDTAPWSTANVGAGSQGQWTYGSSGGGGGGGGCVVLGAEMFDAREAGDYEEGDRILVTNPYGNAGEANSFFAVLSYSKPERQPCVEVTTSRGAVLEMSTTAPIPTQYSDYILAPDLLGRKIPIGHRGDVQSAKILNRTAADTDPINVPFFWDEVIAVRDIGMQWVQHVTVNHEHHCFWAKSGQEWFILHHNLKPLV